MYAVIINRMFMFSKILSINVNTAVNIGSIKQRLDRITLRAHKHRVSDCKDKTGIKPKYPNLYDMLLFVSCKWQCRDQCSVDPLF